MKRRSKRKGPPFVTVPTTLLAASRIRNLTPAAMQIYLRAPADWRPFKKPRLLLLSNSLPLELHMDGATFRDARDELIEAGLLTCTKAAVRPGGMGSDGVARAAEYDLPHRHDEVDPKLDADDRRFQNSWRIDCGDLRRIAETVDGTVIVILLTIVLPQDREPTGEVIFDKVTPITAAGCFAALAGTPNATCKKTIERALNKLAALGLIRCSMKGAGSRATRYLPAGDAAAGSPWKRRPKP
jgi:hypothetical protein